LSPYAVKINKQTDAGPKQIEGHSDKQLRLKLEQGLGWFWGSTGEKGVGKQFILVLKPFCYSS